MTFFTKNVSAEIMKKHIEYVGTKEDITGENEDALLDYEARRVLKIRLHKSRKAHWYSLYSVYAIQNVWYSCTVVWYDQ